MGCPDPARRKRWGSGEGVCPQGGGLSLLGGTSPWGAGCVEEPTAGSSRAGSYINSHLAAEPSREGRRGPVPAAIPGSPNHPKAAGLAPFLLGMEGTPPWGENWGEAAGSPVLLWGGWWGCRGVASLVLFGVGSVLGEGALGRAGFPRREAGACRVSLMISNEQLPPVSPLISEYQ